MQTPDSLTAIPTRAPYVPPVLEALGEWSALTLQQTIPIAPADLESTEFHPGDYGY